ncbi:MAG: hypothetical protein AAF564_17330 [Bacteroidota bacterium]
MKYLLLLALAFLGVTQTAYACSCIAPPGPLEAMSEADFVFSGTVETVIPVDKEYGKNILVKLRVLSQWKGGLSEEVFVETADNSAACGYNFERKKSYLVYGSVHEGVMTTNICTRTTSLDNASEDLRALGDGEQTTSKRSLCGGPTNAVVIQTFMFLMIGMACSRRRPRWTRPAPYLPTDQR